MMAARLFQAVTLFLLALSLTFLVGARTQQLAAQDEPKVDGKKDDKKGIDRTGATRKRLLKDFGGSEEGEEAVMLGLAWLTQKQKDDGGWVYEVGRTNDTAPATGMAVLAFLGAGQSHKEGRYKQTVKGGLDWLVKNVEPAQSPNAGHFKGAGDMYGQGIATLALCEAYGMTQDSSLKNAAQLAVDYIQRAQAGNGSWGYQSGQVGDTSIVGWQIQALHAAQLAGLKVDDGVIKKAVQFLDRAGSGRTKSSYGYLDRSDAQAGTSLTAIGLLCRYYIDGWRSTNAGFAEGTKGLLKGPKGMPTPELPKTNLDLYYFYYATQVVRFHGGNEWKDWNEGVKRADGTRKGGMPDWLIAIQNRTPTERGSWDPESGWIGTDCGRLGTTCMCLLTLEVYYRYTPESNQNEPKKP